MTLLHCISISFANPIENKPNLFGDIQRECTKLGTDHVFQILEVKNSKDSVGRCMLGEIADGPTLRLDMNNKRIYQGAFQNDLHNGPWKRWDSKENLMDEGTWINDKPDGAWTFYYPHSSKIREQVFFKEGFKKCTIVQFTEAGIKQVGDCTYLKKYFSSRLRLFNQNWTYSLGSFSSGGGSWSPEWKSYFAEIGVLANHSSVTATYFPATQAIVGFSYDLNTTIRLRAGAGAEIWHSVGVAMPLFSL